MPYEWITPTPGRQQIELHLWPYRSLPRRDFVWFIGITVGMISLPLIGLVGSPVLWALLPFPVAAVAGIWWAIERSYSDGAILEQLQLWPDRITLTRQEPRKPLQSWDANPHWVEIALRPLGGPVEDYVTLRGAGREVEIGAFLSQTERQSLHRDLAGRLRQIVQTPASPA